ncbi:MAG: hypothetical protein KGJ31_02955 [Patescibacteria group bacterium]|nr:hypothetical protein [Patescibacteria group bacterium]
MDDVLETELNSEAAMPRVGRSVLAAFCYWYVAVAPRNIVAITGNYLVANLNYFSIAFLVRTLLAPWHRDTETYGRGFDPARYARAAIVNAVSRVVGLLIRSVTILIGLAAEVCILAVGVSVFILWFAAPFLLFFGLTQTPTPHLSLPQIPAFPSLPVPSFAPPVHGIR